MYRDVVAFQWLVVKVESMWLSPSLSLYFFLYLMSSPKTFSLSTKLTVHWSETVHIAGSPVTNVPFVKQYIYIYWLDQTDTGHVQWLFIAFVASNFTQYRLNYVYHVYTYIEWCTFCYFTWGYRGGSPTAVRPSDPALCGSCPLVTPY